MAINYRFFSIASLLIALSISVIRSCWFLDLSNEIYLQIASVVCLLLGSIFNWLSEVRNNKTNKFDLIHLFFLIYCIWIIASLFWSIDKTSSAQQIVLFIAVIGYGFSSYLWRWSNQHQITKDILVLFVYISSLSILGFVLVIVGIPQAIGDFSRFRGILFNPTYTGAVGAFAAPMGIYLLSQYRGFAKILISIGISLGITAALAGGARGALIALVASIAVGIYYSKRIDAVYSIGAVIVAIILWIPFISGLVVRGAGLFSFLQNINSPNQLELSPISIPETVETAEIDNSSTIATDSPPNVFQRSPGADISSGRFDLYISALDSIKKSPLIGFGFRTSKQVLGIGMETHNSYLGILLEIGLIGLTLFLALLVVIFRQGGFIPFASVAIYVLVKEFTDSMILGSGGIYAAIAWLVLFAYARLGKLAQNRVKSLKANLTPRFLSK